MAFVILFILGLLISLGLQRWLRSALISLSVPSMGFITYVLFCEFVLPYGGGGASMWPIALIFGIPVVLTGSACGLFLGRSPAKR